MGLSAKAAAHGRVVILICAGILAAWWLLYNPVTSSHNGYYNFDFKIYNAVSSKFLATGGDEFLFQIVPMILLAALGFIALLLRRKRNENVRAVSKKARLNVWTMPVILHTPFGMLTLGELIFISLIVFVMTFYYIKEVVWDLQEWSADLQPSDPKRSIRVTYVMGVAFAWAGVIPMTLLWIPVSRGSPFLNVLGIPFESAIKYHIWLGLLTLWCMTLHGIFTIAYYIALGQANVTGLFSWHVKEIAILPGFLSGVSGAAMLVTAVEYIRRRNYDFFFIAHHLYILFLLFFTFHASWWLDMQIIPVLLFFLDRFMRAVQSRRTVDVLSAKVLTSGAIELTFAKSPQSTYHALSFVYVMIPSVSKLMWHPFSLASSPLDESNKITIYIKPLGKYTEKLHDVIISSKQYGDANKKVFKCPFSFKVGVEGSYSSEDMFYLRYQSLVLVAGGIGVTPFLAILRDIFHRYRLKQEYLPTSVELIFCVKSADELHILDTLALDSILPDYQEHVRLTVRAFVTQDGQDSSRLQTDENQFEMNKLGPSSKRDQGNMYQEEDIILVNESTQPMKEMSRISGNGDTRWVVAVFAVTITSYICLFGLFNLKNSAVRDNGVIRTMIYMVCIFISVVIFGGGTMLIWSFFDKRERNRDARVLAQTSPMSPSPSSSPVTEKKQDVENTGVASETALWKDNIVHGRRPVWNDEFNDLAKRYAGQNVGVMVSGLWGLQQDVASQCRRHSLRRDSTVVFHYHSVSFDL